MEVVEAERLAAAEGLSLVPAATATGYKGIVRLGADGRRSAGAQALGQVKVVGRWHAARRRATLSLFETVQRSCRHSCA